MGRMTLTSTALLVAIVLLHFAPGYSATVTSVQDEEKCQNMTYADCQMEDGWSTTMPNTLGHRSQEEAARGFNQFYPFLQTGCSPLLKTFLCHIHFPMCHEALLKPILPCREMCERVRDECSTDYPLILSLWPDCDDLNSQLDPSMLCFNTETLDEGSTMATNTSMPSTEIPMVTESCEPIIDVPFCGDREYSDVTYPNLLGHSNQSQAVMDLHRYSVFFQDDSPCTPLFKTYICHSYQPPCKVIGRSVTPILPCRDLCSFAKLDESCLRLLASLSMDLPEALSDCSRYPRKNMYYRSCYTTDPELNPLLPHVPYLESPQYLYHRCSQIAAFPSVQYPNILDHMSKDDVMAELTLLMPLIRTECSDELLPFICLSLLSDPSHPKEGWWKLPCQPVCNRVWKSCRATAGQFFPKRPRILTCRLFPQKLDCVPELTAPTESVEVKKSTRYNLTHGLIEYQTKYERVTYRVYDTWGMGGWILEWTGPSNVPQALFISLEFLEGYHVVIAAKNPLGEGPSTAVWIPAFPNENITGACEDPVDIPQCRSLGYNFTSYPNVMSNWNADEVRQAWHQFYPENEPVLPATGCAWKVLNLVCSLLVPRCTTTDYNTIDPCSELLDEVQRECVGSQEQREQGWSLDLIRIHSPWLPKIEERPCISGDLFGTRLFHRAWEGFTVCSISERAPPTSKPEFFDPSGNRIDSASPQAKNSNIEVTILSPRLSSLHFKDIPKASEGNYTCKAMGATEGITFPLLSGKCYYDKPWFCEAVNANGYVRFPTLIGHTEMGDVAQATFRYLPLVSTNCSANLPKLVCALYAPQCSRNEFDWPEPYTQICREFCEEVKRECWEAAQRIGFRWPDEASCDLLKPANESTSMEDSCQINQANVGPRKKGCIKLRRYDVTDHGVEYLFHGWTDVQGQGAANDYCRVVSTGQYKMISCALAGTQGDSQYNYNSSNPDAWLDLGHSDTWYMKDEDGDARDDYCRCIGSPPDTRVSCLKAGEAGFEEEFSPDGASVDCQYIKVNQLFGP